MNISDPFDPTALPTVYCHSEDSAKQARLLDRIAGPLRESFPDGLRCTVHELMPERVKVGRCGPWYASLDHDPFPEGFYALDPETGELARFTFPVRRDVDGLWRPLAGGLCGFTLTDAKVREIARRDRLMAGIDARTGEVLLVRADNDAAPSIPLQDWMGECNKCGLCCWSPRYGTGWWCDALEPTAGDANDLQTAE